MTETAKQNRLVDAKLLYAAYSRKPFNIFLTATCTFIVGGVLWEIFPTMAIGVWIAAMLLIQILGWMECRAFKRAKPGPDAITPWQWLFLAQSAASGAAWSLGPTWLISQSAGAESAFFVGTLMSVATVAMFSVSEQRSAMTAMIVTTFLPPMIAFWSTGGAVEMRIALVLLCGMAASIAVGFFFSASMRKLVEGQMRTDAMLNTAFGAVVGIDARGKITRWSHHAEVVFAWTQAEVIGQSFEATIFPQQTVGTDGRSVIQLLINGDIEILNRKLELMASRKGGEEFPIELVLTAHEMAGGYEFTVFIADISERKQAAAAIVESEVRFRTLIEWVPEAIAVHRNGIVLYANAAAIQLFGAASAQELVGLPIKDRIHPDSLVEVRERLATLTKLGSTTPRMGGKYLRLDGSVVDVEAEGIAISYDQGPAILASIHDVTERKKAEVAIQNLAFRDPLTQLPNRRLLLDRLKRAVASSNRSDRHTALMFVDLDKFKTLNDHHGHDVGDLLLQEVGQRLTACVRDVDTVARLGGDEFIVMLEALSDQLDEAAMQAETIGRKILSALNSPYHFNGNTHRSSSSIGVTLFTKFEGSANELLKRADLAMYQAKAAGRNTLSFFDPGLQAELTHRLVLESDLRDAINAEQFILYYQAQVTMVAGVSGAEALVRWNHPQRGILAPAEFVAVAEETGLIVPLGSWVLRSACRQLGEWAKRPEMAHLTIAVNVSASQLRRPNFVDEVLAILQQSGANPRRLKLELTESELVYDIDDVVAKMTLLKAADVGFALDDFGTGYSSLAYLKQLPLDELKIDQGFIKHILDDAIDSAIATMVVALAKSLGLRVIAEGVETEAQRLHLLRLGCHAYQGYLFSHPLPLADFEQFATRKLQEISAHTGA